MSHPLLVKELREIWWMGLAALVVASCVAIDAMGIGFSNDGQILWRRKRGQSPFIGASDFSSSIGWTALFLGSALGLWQTLSESVTGTWSFLLHRPITRRQVVATKLLAGTGLLIVSIGLPLLFYFLWAMSGVHKAPFELWMVEDTLRFWAAGMAGYLAAFLAGIRTARIYVSRLWPLVTGLLIFVAQEEAWPNVGWCLILLGVVLLLPSVFFAALHRDYA